MYQKCPVGCIGGVESNKNKLEGYPTFAVCPCAIERYIGVFFVGYNECLPFHDLLKKLCDAPLSQNGAWSALKKCHGHDERTSLTSNSDFASIHSWRKGIIPLQDPSGIERRNFERVQDCGHVGE